MSRKPKTVKLTMRLLKKGKTAQDAMKEYHGLEQYSWPHADGCQFYAGTVYAGPPAWLPYLKTSIPNTESLFNRGSAAVLFVPVKRRVVMVSFGHAQFATNPDVFERNFGLRVTLNSVSRDQIRSIDSATPDSVTIQRRIQASQNSDVSLFGIDINRDLLTTAAGAPTDASFATFVAGKDSLTMNCAVTPEGLLDKCREVVRVYESKAYKKEFAWVDYVRPVKDKDETQRLDEALFHEIQKLRAGKFSDLHLAPPEIVDYTEGNLLHYNGFGSAGEPFECLDILDYVAELNRCGFVGDIAEIKQKHRIAVQREGENAFTERWKVYDSFVYEVALNKRNYVLFGGDWFAIDRDFARTVERFFDDMETITLIGPTSAKNEQELLEEVERAKKSDWVKLDKMKLNPRGSGRANIEPCDFYTSDKQFVHIKDGHSSGPISHLWMQGVVSAESFLMDDKFRKDLRAKTAVIDKQIGRSLPDGRQKVMPTEYQVVFAIMRKPYRDGSVGLPFFSKVSLRTAVLRLQSMGYPVFVELIPKLQLATKAA